VGSAFRLSRMAVRATEIHENRATMAKTRRTASGFSTLPPGFGPA
jgi:hypothetical protein